MFKRILLVALLALSVFSLKGITELSDANFKETVFDDNESLWLVLFAAEWCGHCKKLKPELQTIAPQLNQLGMKVGHVDEKQNKKLVNDYVVDHKTHMVGYPKLKVFLGKQLLGEVPGRIRAADDLLSWLTEEYNLGSVPKQEEL